MRITYIAAGAGGSHCGACTRDVTLVQGLRARGHDALLIPVYTPIRSDGPDPTMGRVFYGGINAYLQQKCAIFRKTPRFVDWLFDRPALLRLVSRFAIETRPEQLGPMTVSVLAGEDGRQRKELEALISFLADADRPHAVNLTNSLLAGLAGPIKRRLGVPLVCTLQGEDSFVQRLPPPYAEQAQGLMQEHARGIDCFVAPGDAYADAMAQFLAIERKRVRVVRPGVDSAVYASQARQSREPFRVGYLSRVTPAKGLDVLAEAFCALPHRDACVLAVAGEVAPQNRKFRASVKAKLEAEGLADRLEYAGELDLAQKVDFLQSCHVFCLPSRYPEQRAMAALEAMSTGAPLVAPDRGVFTEMIQLTGGGLLVPPDDAAALAQAIESLFVDRGRAESLGRAAAEGVASHFSADGMVEETVKVYEDVIHNG